jgi:hypothetical protein
MGRRAQHHLALAADGRAAQPAPADSAALPLQHARPSPDILVNAPVPPEPGFLRALLPWEDCDELNGLRQAWHEDLKPSGAAEMNLADQLVWIDWRRRRLLAAERGSHLASLEERMREERKAKETMRRALIAEGPRSGRLGDEELRDAIAADPARDGEELADAAADEAMTRRAIAILETGDPAAYGEALAALRSDTAGWWEDTVRDDEQTHPDGEPELGESYRPHSRTAESLLRFLREYVMPIFETTRLQVARRPAIRLQAQGESLDPFRFERILALDERLTRQMQRTLAMLVRLQECRRSKAWGTS